MQSLVTPDKPGGALFALHVAQLQSTVSAARDQIKYLNESQTETRTLEFFCLIF